MSIFGHARTKIFSEMQHPLKHDLSGLAYTNAAFPSVSTLIDFLDYISAWMYPQYLTTVADLTALNALVGMNPNDYVIVLDDGDGKSAGYVYQVIEAAGTWHKRYDSDWSLEGILAEFTNRTQYQYVQKYGLMDIDASGTALAGALAGQHIYGGINAGSHLTLHANSANADTTGYIQAGDSVRPTADNTFLLGTSAAKWANIYGQIVSAGDITITDGSIQSSSGEIDFGTNDLRVGGNIIGDFNLAVTDGDFDTLHIQGGSITDSTGAIDFGNENLTTSGNFTATQVNGGNLRLAGNTLSSTDTNGNIILLPNGTGIVDIQKAMTTIGQTVTGIVAVTGSLTVDNLSLDANTISSTNANGNLLLVPNGTGVVDVQKAMTTLGQTVTGIVAVTGSLTVDNLSLDGNTLSTTDANGNLLIVPNGTGLTSFATGIFPATTNSLDLGKTGNLWKKLWLGTSIEDGTNSFLVSDLMTLRSTPFRDTARTQAAQAGDTIFWDGTKWLASAPDTEINHAQISGLTTTDAGHTQFVMLAGRSGGQVVQGGTAASEFLTLESTSHVTKGSVRTKDNLIPFTNASYAASWSGTDLGDSTHYYRDVYTKGEFKGLRLENFTVATLPASSGSAGGRLVYATDSGNVYVDNGSTFKLVGGGGGGGSLAWVEDLDAPQSIQENADQLYVFEDALAQHLYALIRVPSSYSAGSPIKLRITCHSAITSGTMLVKATATLIRVGTDALTSTANQRTTTNAAITLSGGTVNVPQAVVLDISSTSGQINGVAIAAGDLIRVDLTRDTATDTAAGDVKVPVYGAEVTFV